MKKKSKLDFLEKNVPKRAFFVFSGFTENYIARVLVNQFWCFLYKPKLNYKAIPIGIIKYKILFCEKLSSKKIKNYIFFNFDAKLMGSGVIFFFLFRRPYFHIKTLKLVYWMPICWLFIKNCTINNNIQKLNRA